MAKSKVEVAIKPLGKAVLVQLKKGKPVSEGGIIMPETANREPGDQLEATVVTLGSGKLDEGKKHTFEVKVGDVVLLSSYSGTKLERNGNEYVVVKESDIVAIVE